MRVSSARENAQVTHLLTAKRSARDHAFNGFFQNAFRETTLQHLGSGHALDTASIAGVLVVNLVLQLLARELHLFGVDHDDIVTAIDMRGRSEEHTSELQSLMRISYAVFCLKKKKKNKLLLIKRYG